MRVLQRMVWITALVALLPSMAMAAGWCGDPPGQNLDYLNPEHRKRLGLVERFHFTEEVRTLRRGATGYLIGDLEYVLNYYPNHHAALDALSRLAVREGRSQPHRAEWPIECRFQWARQVNPEDAMVPLIQGLHAFRTKKMDAARKYLEESASMAPDNPEVHYNLGLVLFDLGEYEAAREHARQAYARGYPLPGLKDMLRRSGHPVDVPAGEGG